LECRFWKRAIGFGATLAPEMGERYSFEDVWRIPVSREIAWRMVDDVANWPSWWPDYRSAEVVSEVRHGVGARWHVRVKSNLPYTVDFHFTVLQHNPPAYVMTAVEGFFTGEIDWTLEEEDPGMTRMTLRERTETTWALINLTARLGGRRLLERNHAAAMRRGEEGALAGGYLPPDIDGTSGNPTPGTGT
jgi:ribosome-associated toxin RatA of RatAB toxin-antitoxin module